MQVIECIIQRNIKNHRFDISLPEYCISLSFSREEDDKLERYVEELVLQVLSFGFAVHTLYHILRLSTDDLIQEKEKEVDVYPIVKAKKDLQLGRWNHSPKPYPFLLS